MNLLYTKICEVIIRHDYYLDAVSTDNTTTGDYLGRSIWPADYNILSDLEIVPTEACRKIMKDYQLVFKPFSLGFRIFARAIPSELSPSQNNDLQTFIFIEPDVKLSFLIKLKNRSFFNYTNLRLIGNEQTLYYFSNRSRNGLGITTNGSNIEDLHQYFLSANMPVYSDQANQYHLGDLVLSSANGNVLEALQNIPAPQSGNTIPNAPIIVNSANNCTQLDPATDHWVQETITDARYVTINDRLSWQGNIFVYRRDNLNPDEIIDFELKDDNGNLVKLGNIPNTNTPQSRIRAPKDSTIDVEHRIDLSTFPPGSYTMRVQATQSGAEPDRAFYLLPPQKYKDTFGVIELFAGAPSPAMNPDARFLEPLPNPANAQESVIRFQRYEIRFKNRTTCWKYFRPNRTEFTNATIAPLRPRRGLKRNYSEVEIDDVLLPDPEVNLIHPELVNNDPNFIQNIFSEIYLTR